MTNTNDNIDTNNSDNNNPPAPPNTPNDISITPDNFIENINITFLDIVHFNFYTSQYDSDFF